MAATNEITRSKVSKALLAHKSKAEQSVDSQRKYLYLGKANDSLHSGITGNWNCHITAITRKIHTERDCKNLYEEALFQAIALEETGTATCSGMAYHLFIQLLAQAKTQDDIPLMRTALTKEGKQIDHLWVTLGKRTDLRSPKRSDQTLSVDPWLGVITPNKKHLSQLELHFPELPDPSKITGYEIPLPTELSLEQIKKKVEDDLKIERANFKKLFQEALRNNPIDYPTVDFKRTCRVLCASYWNIQASEGGNTAILANIKEQLSHLFNNPDPKFSHREFLETTSLDAEPLVGASTLFYMARNQREFVGDFRLEYLLQAKKLLEKVSTSPPLMFSTFPIVPRLTGYLKHNISVVINHLQRPGLNQATEPAAATSVPTQPVKDLTPITEISTTSTNTITFPKEQKEATMLPATLSDGTKDLHVKVDKEMNALESRLRNMDKSKQRKTLLEEEDAHRYVIDVLCLLPPDQETSIQRHHEIEFHRDCAKYISKRLQILDQANAVTTRPALIFTEATPPNQGTASTSAGITRPASKT
jgi:hypothetical protein